MDVKKKIETTYDLTNLTECQMQDLLEVCCLNGDAVKLDVCEPRIEETLKNLRESILNTGLKRGAYDVED